MFKMTLIISAELLLEELDQIYCLFCHNDTNNVVFEFFLVITCVYKWGGRTIVSFKILLNCKLTSLFLNIYINTVVIDNFLFDCM